MQPTATPKYFLDTSVARPIVLGTKKYQEYFSTVFQNSTKYISPFVEMEFRRSFICTVIDAYFIFKLTQIDDFGDLITFAANKYPSSQLKAFLQLAGQCFKIRKVVLTPAREKEKALYYFAELILRIQSKFHRSFVNTGRETTKCARASIKFDVKLKDVEAGFRKFQDEFSDTKGCRKKCSIDTFFIKRHKKSVEGYIQRASKIDAAKENDGFKKVADTLSEILKSGGKICSCKVCGSVGDAIITLNADREMILHHTDQSFDHLCPPVSQPHQKHASETAIVSQSVGVAPPAVV